jgi:hypothetical protein
MARFYCKESELVETAQRAGFTAPRGMTQDASPLTCALWAGNND